MTSQKTDLREPPVHVVLIDSRGIVTDVQLQGQRPGRANGSDDSQYAVGESYLDHCHSSGHRAEVNALLKRKRSLVSFVVPPRPQMPNRWIVVVGVPVGPEVGSGALLMHIDITAWVSERKADDELSPDRQMPVTLNPSLIQDTISKALVRQSGRAPELPQGASPANADVKSLSPRQREVLLLVAAGKSNQEIAEELSCSLNTIKRHVTAILQKLRLPNRTRAAMLANQLNLLAKSHRRSSA
jgi:DNA-binding CsgD family transcriptional regulator